MLFVFVDENTGHCFLIRSHSDVMARVKFGNKLYAISLSGDTNTLALWAMRELYIQDVQ